MATEVNTHELLTVKILIHKDTAAHNCSHCATHMSSLTAASTRELRMTAHPHVITVQAYVLTVPVIILLFASIGNEYNVAPDATIKNLLPPEVAIYHLFASIALVAFVDISMSLISPVVSLNSMQVLNAVFLYAQYLTTPLSI